MKKNSDKLSSLRVWRKIAEPSFRTRCSIFIDKKCCCGGCNERWEKYVKRFEQSDDFQKLNSSLAKQEVTFIQFIVDEKKAVLKPKGMKSNEEFDELELRELPLNNFR